MTHRFTSLRHPLEKLLEAEYFLAAVTTCNGLEFQFNLNAFLSACRSTTFTLQKSMADVAGFARWYAGQQANMRADPAMGFFLELRNIAQHEGPVSYVGGAMLGTPHWSYRFAGNREAVPDSLRGVDVGAACADHLVKVARLLLDCVQAFPFACCPVAAVTPEGMAAMSYSLADVGTALGLPLGYLEVAPEIPVAEKLRILAKEFEPLDRLSLQRIATGRLEKDGQPIETFRSVGEDLTDVMAAIIEAQPRKHLSQREVFVAAVAARIGDRRER